MTGGDDPKRKEFAARYTEADWKVQKMTDIGPFVISEEAANVAVRRLPVDRTTEMLRTKLKLELVPISPDNYELAKELKVRPDQEELVASVQKSLADAYVYSDAMFRLASVDSLPVGYLLVFPFDSDRGRTVNIVRLMIDHRFQSQGMGRELLATALEWIKTFQPAVEAVRVSTLPHNQVALHLYESNGFVREGMENGEVAFYLALDRPESDE